MARTFTDVIPTYLEHMAAEDRRPRSIDTVSRDLRKLATVIGHIPIKMFTQQDIRAVLGWLNNQDLSPATKNRYLRHLKAALRFFHQERNSDGTRWLEEVPAIKFYTEGKRKGTRALTPKELQQLFTANARKPWLVTLLHLLVGTGCRIGEAAHLTWGDVVSEDGGKTWTLNITAKPHWKNWRPKSHHERSIPLSRDLVNRLFSHRAIVPCDSSDPIFPAKGGGPWNTNNLSRAVKNAFTRAGLTDHRRCSAHALRRAYATFAKQATDFVTVSQTLGHRSVSTTERYFEVDHQAARVGAEAIADALRSAENDDD